MTCEICGNQSRVALWKKNQTNDAETEKNHELKNVPEQSESRILVIPKIKNSNSMTVDPTTAKVTKPNDQVTKRIAANSQAVKNVNDSPKKVKPNKNKNKTLLLSNTSKKSTKKCAPSTSAMKKNSLLQLAAALKTNTKISNSNCRLKQMFNSSE